MRIGRWVPVYQRLVPIPRSIDMGLNLFENAELHLAVVDNDTITEHRADLLLSPVPARLWRSVCRLFVRIPESIPSLTMVTRFLREQRVDVLFSEYSRTLNNEARFGAICDISRTVEYEPLAAIPRSDFAETVSVILDRLTSNLNHCLLSELANGSQARRTTHAAFTPLTELSDASFAARFDRIETLRYRAGAIELPYSIGTYVSYACGFDPPTLPGQVLLTANREQHYVRMEFRRSFERLFRLQVETTTFDFAGGNADVLDQFVRALPPRIEVLSAAANVIATTPTAQHGRIEILGDWHDVDGDRAGQAENENHLRGALDGLVIHDREGRSHREVFRLVSLAATRASYPRVYISYSAGGTRDERVVALLSALNDNDFTPVLGTQWPESADDARQVAPDVLRTTFSAIATCVAVISLHTKRDDYAVMGTDGRPRYVLPPWVAAEEAYAIVSSPLVLRLRGKDVEDPRYGQHTWTHTFDESEDASFLAAVEAAVSELNKFRLTERFRGAWETVQRSRFREYYAPPA
jgi:hypothetical protein